MTAHDVPAHVDATSRTKNGTPDKTLEPIAYTEIEDADWAMAIDTTLAWESSGPYRYIKHGTCPACGHPITIKHEEEIVLGFRADHNIAAPTYMDARCNCPEAHPNMTAGAGCGRSGRILLPRPTPDD